MGMLSKVLLLSLSSLFLFGDSASLSGEAPPVPSQVIPSPSEEDSAKCLLAANAIQKWGTILNLKQWTYGLVCDVPPDSEKYGRFVHGASAPNPEALTVTIYYNPKSELPPEEIIIHELLHIIFEECEQAKSAVITERNVRSLAELFYKARGEY